MQNKTMPINFMMNVHEFSKKKGSSPDGRQKDSGLRDYRKDSNGSHP
ncbi:MAG: hypothetical protein ACK521_04085 [bacterium]